MSEPMKPHVQAGRIIRFLAWLQMIAVVGIAAAIIIPVVTGGKGVTSPAQFFLIAILILVVSLGIAKFLFVLGTALKEHKEWARKAGIVLGIIQLFGFPLGTILGAYILWALTKGWNR